MSLNTFSLRHATPHDTASIVALIESAYRGDSGRKGWTTESDLIHGQRTDADEVRALMAQENTWFLLAETPHTPTQLLASCLLEQRGDGLYFGMFAVRPDLQAQGIGKAILDAAETFGQERACTHVLMQVIMVRDALIAWYERRGYVRTGHTLPFPYGEERFGIPQQEGLYFVELRKELPASTNAASPINV